MQLTAYTIRNNNYFKLKDLGRIFNFAVIWDNASKTISIDTSKDYTEEDSYDGVVVNSNSQKPTVPKVVSVTGGKETDTIVITFNKPMNEASVKKVFDDKLAILLHWYYSGDHGWGFLLGSLRYDPGSTLTINDLLKINSDKTQATIKVGSAYWLDGSKREIIVDLTDCTGIVDAEGKKLQLDITDTRRQESLYLVTLNPHLEGEAISQIEAFKERRDLK